MAENLELNFKHCKAWESIQNPESRTYLQNKEFMFQQRMQKETTNMKVWESSSRNLLMQHL